MKIEDIEKIEYYVVDFFDEDYTYERHSEGHWRVRIGESTETIFNQEKEKALESAFKEWLNQH